MGLSIKALSVFALCLLLLSAADTTAASEAGVDMDCYNRCMSYIINGSECSRRCDNQRGRQLKENGIKAPGPDLHDVVEVYDGDTLILRGNIRVRLIGVDTPDARHVPFEPIQRFGREAQVFTKRMVEGKKVRLEYDWHIKDKRRVWAYVYLMDGTLLNAELIKRGYGRVPDEYTFKYSDEFKAYELNARENKKGMWD